MQLYYSVARNISRQEIFKGKWVEYLKYESKYLKGGSIYIYLEGGNRYFKGGSKKVAGGKKVGK